MQTTKFKTGDRVKVILFSLIKGISIGDVGTVISSDCDMMSVVKMDKSNRGQTEVLWDSELELV